MKKEDEKTRENIDKLSKVIAEKKKIPQNIKDKINAKIFENLLFVAVIIVYLGALNLGMVNIPTENYLVDLKVFGVILLVVTIILIEIAYKKDKGSLWIHSIELMVLSFFTMYLVYFYSIYYNTFGTIIFSFIFICMIYYTIKILVARKRIIKEYNKSLIDIGEIVKKK